MRAHAHAHAPRRHRHGGLARIDDRVHHQKSEFGQFGHGSSELLIPHRTFFFFVTGLITPGAGGVLLVAIWTEASGIN